MREHEAEKAGKNDLQFVRARDAFTRRKRVLDSPLGGLQILAAHLNELPGQRAQMLDPDCPTYLREEIAAWEVVEHIVTRPLPQAVDLFNAQARLLPMLLQVELVQGDPAPFIASCETRSDRRGEVLRPLWWYYFRKNGWARLKTCPVCDVWFVDVSKNRVTARCSSACTAKWWSREKRKEAGHTLTPKGGKSHGTKRR